MGCDNLADDGARLDSTAFKFRQKGHNGLLCNAYCQSTGRLWVEQQIQAYCRDVVCNEEVIFEIDVVRLSPLSDIPGGGKPFDIRK